jgi:hypothetical protein
MIGSRGYLIGTAFGDRQAGNVYQITSACVQDVPAMEIAETQAFSSAEEFVRANA